MAKHTPSTYQQKIYDTIDNTNESIAVNAVAGSGKTHTIVEAGNLIPKNKRYSTAFIAFSVAIRNELATRLPSDMEVTNFHKAGFQVLKDHTRYGFKGKSGVNQWKYNNIAQELLGGRGNCDMEEAKAIADAVGYCMLTLTAPSDTEAFTELCDTYGVLSYPDLDGKVISCITEGIKLTKNGDVVDFNDMIYMPLVLEAKFPKFKNLFVDECQDLNAAQREMVLAMREPGGRTIAVGDPSQAIFGFAGADTDSFQKVQEAIGGIELPLSVCYRCPSSHIELAQEIVPNIVAAPNAKVGIIERITYGEIYKNVNPKTNDLVLSRTTAPLVALVFDLIKNKIPAKIKGRSDILKGIKTLARKVVAIAEESQDNKSLAWLNFDSVLDKLQYEEEMRLKKRYPNDQRRVDSWIDKCNSLSVLHDAAIEQGVRSLGDFENWMGQFFDESIHGMVVLSTVHRAKGLEADNVYILNEANMPHPMAKTPEAQKQEMNLRYVALTRSKDKMVFVEPKSTLRGKNLIG